MLQKVLLGYTINYFGTVEFRDPRMGILDGSNILRYFLILKKTVP